MLETLAELADATGLGFACAAADGFSLHVSSGLSLPIRAASLNLR